jgi:hypothetical protein
MTASTGRAPVFVLLASLWATVAVGEEPRPSPSFSRDIAPIMIEHCANCHRPGESGPFHLLTYDDVRKRGRQIAQVTRSGYMPPWLPDPGYAPAFVGERYLTPDQIGTIQNWVRDGMPEGDPADLPPEPEWPAGWQLGEPDLVVEMSEAYTLPAEGFDIFRNFVIPVPPDRPRWVRTVELRPGNAKIVHHAVMMIDRTQSSRRYDARVEEL